MKVAKPSPPGLLLSLAAFLRDYVAFAGRRGALGAALVMAGALFEGLGLALIAPMLAILFRNGQNGGTLRRVLDALFRWFGAETVWVRLALLLAIFVAAMALRAVVLLARDVTLGRLRIGFLERQRTRVAEALAAASWNQVARLRHARIVHVMGGDMQQIGGATQFLTQSITALPMLAVQCALAFYLSPPLAILALALLACSAWGSPPNRYHGIFGMVSDSRPSQPNPSSKFRLFAAARERRVRASV